MLLTFINATILNMFLVLFIVISIQPDKNISHVTGNIFQIRLWFLY